MKDRLVGQGKLFDFLGRWKEARNNVDKQTSHQDLMGNLLYCGFGLHRVAMNGLLSGAVV
jgi:hypothetical protein